MKYGIRYDTVPAKNGRVSLRIRVSWCSVRVSAVIASADPSRIDLAAGRSKEPAVSSTMKRIEGRIATLFSECDLSGTAPTKTEVMAAIKGRETAPKALTPITAHMERFIAVEGRRNDWTEGTVKKWRTLVRNITGYNASLSLADLNEATVAGLVAYLERIGHRNSTIKKELALLRWFVNWCVREHLCEELPPSLLRPKVKSADSAKQVIYLEWSEVLRLQDLDLGSGHALVRDIFVFQCATGLRWSDAVKLRRDDIYNDAIHIVTAKTSDSLTIELNATSRAILARYNASGKVFPPISGQKANQYLKDLCRWAEIDTPINIVYYRGARRIEEPHPKWELVTTHCGRRTFVVRALRLGIPAEVVMRWTGHSNYNAMKPYIAIVDELKRESMAKFDQKTTENRGSQ